jgi:hypothetical protein
MTVRDIAALMRRHLLAVTIVLVIAAAVVLDIKTSPTTYAQTATVVFTARNSLADPRTDQQMVVPLIADAVMMSQIMLSPPEQSQVNTAGGTASFDFTPYNLYSMQYPDYSEPEATLTVTAQSAAVAQSTFSQVMRVLGQRLTAMQARVPPPSRVQAYLVGNSGPVPQSGSSARELGGLALLTVLAVFAVANFLDRRERRPAVPRPGARRAAGRRRRLAAG